MATSIKIKKINGIPRLLINGNPASGITYHNRQNNFYDYMKQFANSGTELFFSYCVRNWNDSWENHFKKVGNQLDTILSFNDRIYVILGVYLSATMEWAAANPDELCGDTGKPCMIPYKIANTERLKSDSGCITARYSFASEKFDEVSHDHINRTIDFLETYKQKDRIIGLFFGAGSTHEWNAFSPDQGPSAIQAFRQYLKAKYRTETRLKKCWNDKTTCFNELSAPSKEEQENAETGYYHVPNGRGQRVIDWKLAMVEAKSRRMLNAARAVKNRRPELITGCFHGNLYNGGGVTGNILKSDAIDFLVSPPQYHARCPGQHMELNQAISSLHVHGKLFFSEEDVRAFDTPWKTRNKKQYVRLPYQGDAANIGDTIAVYEKGLGHTTEKGAMAWYYHFQQKFFKHDKRYFEMNRRMTDISLLNIKNKCRSNSEILVVSDEQSIIYMKPGQRVIQKQVDRELTSEFGYIGAPYDVMFMDALDHPEIDFSKYKLVFFLNNHMSTKKQRALISKLKSKGKTLVFGHGSGFLSETGAGVENMKNLTGFEFEQLDIENAASITTIDTPNPINKYLPTGYAFGQSYRAKLMRSDNKGNALFPPPANIEPVFAVADPHSVDIGFYNLEMPPDYKTAARTRCALPYGLAGYADWPRYFTGIALKEHSNWNSIYIGTPVIPSALIRAICKYAGVHLYVESDDIIYCNNKFLVLHTNRTDGQRKLKFPAKTNVYNLKTKKRIAQGVKTLTIDCPARRTWLLWLDKTAPDF